MHLTYWDRPILIDQNLERRKYSQGPPVLSGVTTIKVLNPDTMSNETDMLCKVADIRMGLGESCLYAYPICTYIFKTHYACKGKLV